MEQGAGCSEKDQKRFSPTPFPSSSCSLRLPHAAALRTDGGRSRRGVCVCERWGGGGGRLCLVLDAHRAMSSPRSCWGVSLPQSRNSHEGRELSSVEPRE